MVNEQTIINLAGRNTTLLNQLKKKQRNNWKKGVPADNDRTRKYNSSNGSFVSIKLSIVKPVFFLQTSPVFQHSKLNPVGNQFNVRFYCNDG